MENKNIKAEKARNLAYRKPLVKCLNYEYICEKVYEMQESCEDIRWAIDEDEDILYNVLDENEDEVYQFKTMFSELDYDCEKLLEQLGEEYIPECFDDWFCSIRAGDEFGGYIGYDSYEDDYVSLEYESYCDTEAGKRIKRYTKDEIIDRARQCFKIFVAFMSLTSRYDSIKCAIDVIRDENRSFLETIKELQETYDRWVTAKDYDVIRSAERKLDEIAETVPEIMWLQ